MVRGVPEAKKTIDLVKVHTPNSLQFAPESPEAVMQLRIFPMPLLIQLPI
jgi:hypothetical protein